MGRTPLYSSSRRPPRAVPPAPAVAPRSPDAPRKPARPSRFSRLFARLQSPRGLLVVAVLASLLAGLALGLVLSRGTGLSAKQIEAFVQKSIDASRPLTAADAYETVRKSVVRVRGFAKAEKPEVEGEAEPEYNVGTGVVIKDSGIILTNLHVVFGARRVEVIFEDGTVSEASVTGVRAEHDLAVLQAKTLPDDLEAATMASTANLAPGDAVVAVGFPFGIGPSVSAGVVSGLRREFRSPEGERVLTNLIQFDAAANPGNSGGPLITLSGEVIGIVTGVLNPTKERFFVGIGFAVPIENAAAAVGMPPF